MSDVSPEANQETNIMPDPDFVVNHGKEPVTEAYPFKSPLQEDRVHPVPDTVDEFMRLEPSHESKLPKKLLGVLAIGVVGAAAFFMGSRTGGEDKTVEATPSTTFADTEIEDDSTDTTIDTPAEAPSNGEISAEVVSVNGLDLAVPSSDDIDIILDAIAFNRTQIANFIDFDNYEQQAELNNEFVNYVMHDPTNETSRQQLEIWRNSQQYRQGDSFTEFDIQFNDREVIDKLGNGIAEVLVTMSDGVSSPVRKQLTLYPSEINTPNGTKSVWLIAFETFA